MQHYIEDNDVDPRQCNRNVQKEPWCMKVCVYEILHPYRLRCAFYSTFLIDRLFILACEINVALQQWDEA